MKVATRRAHPDWPDQHFSNTVRSETLACSIRTLRELCDSRRRSWISKLSALARFSTDANQGCIKVQSDILKRWHSRFKRSTAADGLFAIKLKSRSGWLDVPLGRDFHPPTPRWPAAIPWPDSHLELESKEATNTYMASLRIPSPNDDMLAPNGRTQGYAGINA